MASNFIDERGDIVLLDDIEVLYESEPPECGGTVSSASYGGATKKPSHPAKSKKQPGPRGNGIIGEDGGEEEEEVRRAGASRGAAAGPEISSAGASRGAAIGAGTGAGAASASAVSVDGSNSETSAIGGIDGQTAGQTGSVLFAIVYLLQFFKAKSAWMPAPIMASALQAPKRMELWARVALRRNHQFPKQYLQSKRAAHLHHRSHH